MRHYLREIGTHSSIYTISNILTKAIGIILIPIYTRVLSTDEYGIISLVTPLINAFLVFYTFGMRATYGRFYFNFPDRSDEQKKVLGLTILFVYSLALIGNLIITFFGERIMTHMFPGIDFYPYILLGIWTAFFMLAYDIKLNIFRLRQQSIYYGIFSFLKFFGIVALTILAVVHFRMGALGKVLAEIIICALFFVIAGFLLVKDVKFSIEFKRLKELLQYALPVVPHNLSAIITGFVSKFLLNIHYGTALAGVYNIAFLVGSIMNMVITSINLAWNPFFMKTASNQSESDAKQVISQLTTYLSVGIVFVGFVIMVFSREFIMIVTTDDYYAAIKIAPFLIFSYVLRGGYYILVAKIFYIKKSTKYLPLITLSSAFLTIILNAFLIPRWSMMGAALAEIVTVIYTLIFTYYISQKAYPVKYEIKRLLLLLFIGSIVMALFILLQGSTLHLFLLILLKLALLVLYVLLFFIFRFFRKSEIENLKDIISKVKAKYIK